MTIGSFGYGVPRTDLIVFDDMLGANGDDLNSRASSYGGTAAKIPAFAALGSIKMDGNGGAFSNGTNGFYYWSSASPANGDYTNIGLFKLETKTSATSFGLLTRVDASVTTGVGKQYETRWNNGNFELYRMWQGAPAGTAVVTLASAVAYSLSAGDSIWLRFQATGTSTVTLIMDRSTDGITWTNVFNVAQSTSSPITTAGKPGLLLDEAASASTLTHCQLFLAA